MSSSTVSAVYGRCFIIFMSAVILIEGLFYLGLAITGLLQEQCDLQTNNIQANPFHFTTDFIYFQSPECNNNKDEITVVAPPQSTETTIPMDWAVSEVITNRMYIFIITYLVISSLWILFSVLVLVTSCGSITKTKAALFHWPWFVVVIAGSVLDIVASGFFISDITHTTSAQSTFQYVGANPANVAEFASYDPYFATPAIVMTCLSTRIVLIWLLNVFGVSFCISIVRATLTDKASSKQAVSQASTAAVMAMEQSRAVASSPVYPAYEKQGSVMEQNVQIRPKPLPIQTADYYNDANTMNRQSQMSPMRYSNHDSQGLQSPRENLSYHYSNEPQQTRTYQNTETHPDNLNYPPVRMSVEPPLPPRPAIVASMELSTGSALNNRYSQPEFVASNNVASSRVSDELRSQLPWSYTSMLVKPPVPRKPPPKVYPNIPEPDYGEEYNDDPRNTNDGQRQSQETFSKW